MKLRVLIVAIVLVVAAVAVYSGRQYFFAAETLGIDQSPEATEDVATTSDPKSVKLPPEKLKAAGIKLTKVVTTMLRPENDVPGRLKYDDRRHVEVRTATPGIITDVCVNPGDQVKAGDVLIELSSSEVGNARADVLQRTSELKLAAENRDWEKEICDGLAKLSEAIRERVPIDRIKQDFKSVTLGKNREQLLSAYSDVLLAESLVNAVQENAKSGVVPGRIVEERINNRDNAEATLLTALESLTFTAKVSLRHAETQADDLERRLSISQQAVQTLLGHSAADETSAATNGTGTSVGREEIPDSLSLVQLRAPFAGTIERRQFSPSERVAVGDGLLTLADTSTLWVSADLREREWNALVLKPGDEIRVEPSTPGARPLAARVHFVGREVDPSTNAIPLVAVIDNADGHLRPGMFVQVAVPLAESREALTVPESSVLEHDHQTFVFSPDGDAGFRRINIILGLRVDGVVEVISGLSAGEQVVATGGFYLKSEMLLQGEE